MTVSKLHYGEAHLTKTNILVNVKRVDDMNKTQNVEELGIGSILSGPFQSIISLFAFDLVTICGMRG